MCPTRLNTCNAGGVPKSQISRPLKRDDNPSWSREPRVQVKYLVSIRVASILIIARRVKAFVMVQHIPVIQPCVAFC